MSSSARRTRRRAAMAVWLTMLAGGACASASAPVADRTTAPASAATATSPSTPPTASAAPVDPAIGVATEPVEPAYTVERSTFEGLRVVSSIPQQPVGIVYLFHGSGGSADFATKLETVDLLNELYGRGYGFVSTESTERTGDRQWDVDDPSMDSNPDLARLARLREHVIATTDVGPSTPMYGIGMSNGSAFVGLWAAAFQKAGLPVAAIGMYMAGVTRGTASIGGVPVPTFMVVGVNDTRTRPAKERADLRAIAARGIATELHEVPERKVLPGRYLRVPGITTALAEAVVAAYRTAGLIDADGSLAVRPEQLGDIETQRAAAEQVHLPSSLTSGQRLEVLNETKAIIGEHQFNAEFKVQNADFFDAHGR